jgi:hypothetical protein
MRGYGRGRGGGYGRGMGFGRGYWSGVAPGGGYGPGLGRGNPYPYCRFYPWLPRRWWATGINPYGTAPNQWTSQNPAPWPGTQSGWPI